MIGKEWIDVIKNLGETEIKEYRDAINKLRSWTEFNKEFDAWSLGALESFLTHELKKRLEADTGGP